MVIYGAERGIFPLLTLLHVWLISVVIWWMIYIQIHDKQVWKLSDVEGGKEGNEGKLMEIMGKKEIDEKRQWGEQNSEQKHRQQYGRRDIQTEKEADGTYVLI